MAVKARSPREQTECLQFLPGWFGHDIDARIEQVGLVDQFQIGLAATEQFVERLFEVTADERIRLFEQPSHFAVHLIDDVVQILFGADEIVPLFRQEHEPFIDEVELFNRIQIDRTNLLDLADEQFELLFASSSGIASVGNSSKTSPRSSSASSFHFRFNSSSFTSVSSLRTSASSRTAYVRRLLFALSENPVRFFFGVKLAQLLA